jgi:hypothetical protein
MIKMFRAIAPNIGDLSLENRRNEVPNAFRTSPVENNLVDGRLGHPE